MQRLKLVTLFVATSGSTVCCPRRKKKERKGGKNDKMCGCKESCLECRVRECMTENHRGKLCPASRLARTQKTWAKETETQTVVGDSGACPTKMRLSPGGKQTPIPPPRKHPETPRVISNENLWLSDRKEFSPAEYEPLKKYTMNIPVGRTPTNCFRKQQQ